MSSDPSMSLGGSQTPSFQALPDAAALAKTEGSPPASSQSADSSATIPVETPPNLEASVSNVAAPILQQAKAAEESNPSASAAKAASSPKPVKYSPIGSTNTKSIFYRAAMKANRFIPRMNVLKLMELISDIRSSKETQAITKKERAKGGTISKLKQGYISARAAKNAVLASTPNLNLGERSEVERLHQPQNYQDMHPMEGQHLSVQALQETAKALNKNEKLSVYCSERYPLTIRASCLEVEGNKIRADNRALTTLSVRDFAANPKKSILNIQVNVDKEHWIQIQYNKETNKLYVIDPQGQSDTRAGYSKAIHDTLTDIRDAVHQLIPRESGLKPTVVNGGARNPSIVEKPLQKEGYTCGAQCMRNVILASRVTGKMSEQVTGLDGYDSTEVLVKLLESHSVIPGDMYKEASDDMNIDPEKFDPKTIDFWDLSVLDVFKMISTTTAKNFDDQVNSVTRTAEVREAAEAVVTICRPKEPGKWIEIVSNNIKMALSAKEGVTLTKKEVPLYLAIIAHQLIKGSDEENVRKAFINKVIKKVGISLPKQTAPAAQPKEPAAAAQSATVTEGPGPATRAEPQRAQESVPGAPAAPRPAPPPQPAPMAEPPAATTAAAPQQTQPTRLPPPSPKADKRERLRASSAAKAPEPEAAASPAPEATASRAPAAATPPLSRELERAAQGINRRYNESIENYQKRLGDLPLKNLQEDMLEAFLNRILDNNKEISTEERSQIINHIKEKIATMKTAEELASTREATTARLTPTQSPAAPKSEPPLRAKARTKPPEPASPRVATSAAPATAANPAPAAAAKISPALEAAAKEAGEQVKKRPNESMADFQDRLVKFSHDLTLRGRVSNDLLDSILNRTLENSGVPTEDRDQIIGYVKEKIKPKQAPQVKKK